jgi:hypothetical protein
MAGRVLKLGLCIALIACVLELMARLIIFPQYTAMLPDMYWKHPVLGHYNRPNLVVRRFNPLNYDVINRTNSFGMRGAENNRMRELAGVWIAGGSNTYGGYVEDDEVFSAVLRKYGIWAANIASEGHSVPSQAATIQLLAKENNQPTAVILVLSMYFAIADYSVDLQKLEYMSVGNFKIATDPPTARTKLLNTVTEFAGAFPASFHSVRVRLLHSSALYGWFKVGIMGVPALREWTLRRGLRADLDVVRNYDTNLLKPLSDDNPASTLIGSTADYVLAMKKMVERKLGVPFGVVILPSHHQLHPAAFQRFVSHYGLSGQDLDPLRPLTALHRALEDRQVRTLDTFPALHASGIPRLTFPDDGHLTAKAHAIVAKRLAQWIKIGMPLQPEKSTVK